MARIGQGERAARVRVEGGHTLRALGQGVNDMADRIAAASENLERQIEAATAELLEKKNEAELANQAKTRFLAAASHDLRQPMHALGLFVAELGQKPLGRDAMGANLVIDRHFRTRCPGADRVPALHGITPVWIVRRERRHPTLSRLPAVQVALPAHLVSCRGSCGIRDPVPPRASPTPMAAGAWWEPGAWRSAGPGRTWRASPTRSGRSPAAHWERNPRCRHSMMSGHSCVMPHWS